MYLLLLSMSAHLTKELGMAPGGEFRRAFREAHSVPGCLVHLGDRPINVTLKRALGSLSFWQKLKLGINILTSKDSITKEDVEKCKQKDLLESMLEEMAGKWQCRLNRHCLLYLIPIIQLDNYIKGLFYILGEFPALSY